MKQPHYTITDYAERHAVPRSTLQNRIRSAGVTLDSSLCLKQGSKKRYPLDYLDEKLRGLV